MLTTHLHVVQRLRMSGAMPPLILMPLQRVRRLYFYQSLFTFLLFCMSSLYTSVETIQDLFLDVMSYPLINCHPEHRSRSIDIG